MTTTIKMDNGSVIEVDQKRNVFRYENSDVNILLDTLFSVYEKCKKITLVEQKQYTEEIEKQIEDVLNEYGVFNTFEELEKLR